MGLFAVGLAVFFVGVVVGPSVQGTTVESSDKENVILIIADDIGIEKLAKYNMGNLSAKTPNIDDLMEQGIYFTKAYSNPSCSPTRATIITGRYGFRTGVGMVIIQEKSTQPALGLDEFTIPKALGGTSNALIGKWHLQNLTNGDVDSARVSGGFHTHSGLLTGKVKDYYNWTKTVNGTQFPASTYITTDIANDAVQWLKDNQEKQFFLWLAFTAPHEPFQKPPNWMHSSDFLDDDFILGDDPKTNSEDDPTPYYDAMIEAMDTEIGRVLSSLKPEVRSRTNIIFVGDNGTPSEVVAPPVPKTKAKGTLFEGAVRVPMVIVGPKVVQPGRPVDAFVHTVDIFNAVLELMGVNVTETLPKGTKTDSVSFVPYMIDPERPSQRKHVFVEQFGEATRDFLLSLPGLKVLPDRFPRIKDQVPGELDEIRGGSISEEALRAIQNIFNDFLFGRSIRDGRYKFTEFQSGRSAFYDLMEDPFEENDILSRGNLTKVERTRLRGLRRAMETLLNS